MFADTGMSSNNDSFVFVFFFNKGALQCQGQTHQACKPQDSNIKCRCQANGTPLPYHHVTVKH